MNEHSNEPYIKVEKTVTEVMYNPNYGDNRMCKCGHPYHRHFDGYDNNAPVGCKYCGCFTFEEAGKESETMDIVATSKALATRAHEGQIRKFGQDKDKPYIVHPERVASNFSDPILKSIAWLHDVLEDTNVAVMDLEDAGLPPEVVYGVVSLTKTEGQNYLDFILRIKDNPFALPVKIADIKDNMVSLNEGSLKDKYRLALYLLNAFNS